MGAYAHCNIERHIDQSLSEMHFSPKDQEVTGNPEFHRILQNVPQINVMLMAQLPQI